MKTPTTGADPGDRTISKRDNIGGLGPRLLAAQRLTSVLKGARFAPFSSAEIPEGRDRGLANRLVTAALRRHFHLSEIIRGLLSRGLPPRSGSFEAVLRIGLAELLFLEAQASHSAIFLAVEAVKADRRAQHLSKLMNGALRQAQREALTLAELPPERLFPDWLRARWQKAYGADALQRFADALMAGAPLDVTLREDDPGLVEMLDGAPVLADTVRIAERDRPVSALPGYAEGRWWVQDMAAALPARLVAAQAGARVLDLCAAPGGKTAQLAKAGYKVTALDADAERLARVRENLERLGFQAEMVVADGTSYTPPEPFDAVLLDAPCSATGTFRRHPEVLVNRSPGDIEGRVALQRALLTQATRCLVPGGILVYCTCSLEPEEGELQARWAAAQLEGLEPMPVSVDEVAGPAGALSAEGWLRTHPGLTAPGRLGGTMDGFFAARFRRI